MTSHLPALRILSRRPSVAILVPFANIFCIIFMFVAQPARAQLGGENVRGDVGLKSGTQAPPGWYVGDVFYFYNTDEIRGANGGAVDGPQLHLFGDFLLFNDVTTKKLFGGHYGFTVAAATLNSALTLPTLNVSTSTWGFADLYVQPFQLGWNFKHADAMVGYAFFAPTGRYTAGATDNTGLGMWSNEFSAGTTVYFDPKRNWHASAAGFYEIHTSKRDLDQKVGDLFTLEGGIGRAFMHGYANAGLAYFGQWKVTEDSGTAVSPLVAGLKGSMIGAGPEINLPITKHPIFLTFRYLFDMYSRVATQGQSAVLGVVYANPTVPPPVPAASCTVQPSEVMAGEPVTVMATAAKFDPKHALTYQWTSTGGAVAAAESSSTMIDTNGVHGGSYNASVRVSDAKMKKGGEASCMANFTVKEVPKNPPTMSCSANPTSVQTGGTATINCDCKSPDGAAVTIAKWNATGGTVSGSSGLGTLNTGGASPGPITISAACSDTRGLTASASAEVNVESVPPPPPQASKLSECSYPNTAKPWRVDNTCKATLDDVAQALKNQADARLIAIGYSDPVEEAKHKNLAAERAVDAKAYLSAGEAKQEIDPSRIEVRTGTSGGQRAEFWLVPAGATFSQSDTSPVDENVIKPIPDHPQAGAEKSAP
jgi:hypothetical protein